MSKKRLVSRAELARLAGVSAMAITKACAAKLKDATSDKRVDLDHPAVTAYLAARGRPAPAFPDAPPDPAKTGAKRSEAPPAHRPKRRKPAPKTHDAPTADDEIKVIPRGPSSIEDIEHYADMTLREVARRFGSITAHKDWLDMRKRQVEIQEKEIKNRELQGSLISRELVRKHVFSAIEEANNRLLADAAKTIARRANTLSKSGTPVETIEGTVRELLGAVLQPVKDRASRVLREAARAAAEMAAAEAAQPAATET